MALRLKDMEHSEEAGEDRLVVHSHELRERGSESGGRGLEVVVRDLDEEVVDLVRADVVGQVVRPAVVAIHARQLTCNVPCRGLKQKTASR